MRKFDISTDSNCDLYANEIEQLDLHVGHLGYIIDKAGEITEHVDNFKSYEEYVNFFNELRKGGVAKTSILNVDTHVAMFREMAQKGIKNALHIAQSYGLSPTLDNANKAIEIVKEEFPDINYKAIESSTTTVGEGMLVRTACKLRDEGKDLDEVIEILNDMKMKIQHFVIVDNLMFLKRGGRVSGPKAVMGTLLNLKPIIEFTKEGKLEVVRKEMGMKKAMKSVVDEAKNYTHNKIDFQGVIVHCDNLPLAKEFQAQIKTAFGYEPEIRIMGPIIGAHVGPNAVAYAFISNEERPY